MLPPKTSLPRILSFSLYPLISREIPAMMELIFTSGFKAAKINNLSKESNIAFLAWEIKILKLLTEPL